MKLLIKCSGTENHHPSELSDFQGDLKTLSDENYIRLKNAILELGFSEPFAVWHYDGKIFILNGHQRRITILRMEQEGYEIPDLPCIVVQADDIKQAKLKVLSLTSQFGSMSHDGLKEFCEQSDLEMSEVLDSFSFPEIDEFIEDNENNTPDEIKKGDVEFSEFIGESNNYVVLKFDNDIDWLNAQTHFGLKTVSSKRANGKEWSKGIGRVLDGAKYLKDATK